MVVSCGGPFDTFLSGGSLEAREHGSTSQFDWMAWMVNSREVNLRNGICTDFERLTISAGSLLKTLSHSYGEADYKLLKGTACYLCKSLLHSTPVHITEQRRESKRERVRSAARQGN
jgi:hypothetical protein